MTTAASLPQRFVGTRAVGALALGGAKLSLPPGADPVDGQRLVRAALDAGVTLFDTAAAYVPVGAEGHNERLIAAAVAAAGHDGVMIATKGGQSRRTEDDFPIDGRPATLRRQCEASLRALDTERIDLYLLHHPDPSVPIEDSVGELAALQRDGKVDQIGVSNVDVELATRAMTCAPLAAIENSFSPFDQRSRRLLDWCDAHGVAFLAYSPLGGWEHRPYPEAFPALVELATAKAVPTARLVLAWELALSQRMIPIMGVSREVTLRDGLAAVEVDLDGREMGLIDAAIGAA